MNNSNSDLWDKIRKQFDSAPYPNHPLDKSPKDEVNALYTHNLITSYYLRNQKVIDTKNKVILDAGCGSGYKSLILAEANPGAKIVGVDISEESVKLARQRLEYHGFDNAEFHVLSIYDLDKLDDQFDYINCDEVLYLFPDIAVALQAMKAVLKPEGIIRSNLHSSLQRVSHFRAQKLFGLMGLMDDNPGELEMEMVVETMQALKDDVNLKAATWNSIYEGENRQENILMNFLFQGDTGYTINDMFAALSSADLEFIKMRNWRQWDLMKLFKEPDNLPAFLAMGLLEISPEDSLHLFELLHPVYRLLDFWCGHPQAAHSFVQVAEWTDAKWENATVHLHPQFNNPDLKSNVITSVREGKMFSISQSLTLTNDLIHVDSSMALCLLPLFDQPLSMMSLVEYWQKLRPIDPLTGEPIEKVKVFELLQKLLLVLVNFDLIMLE
ncbi:class I SAM-dependent methyltransferase [Dolichospermum sp. ST_con]|nr:class I SAM-dependent methyltransferase [Dolichospermum sp. ST_con]MDD1417979.1 class I SAM-dependent methyltransferase [Dolichospermum sp. ST_sed1]MDD1423525.1 class I SAM-dependent methyltransferase [Dolichospermum sp. ST_sed9]MDD1432295.1 class I SAM-dependent methyltransferase [Dolichospermum sp. ST_sed6]MDD1434935.1 class I SAM-dependent methyltransferase [Dolichospermum sp. ST_sed10]MDD1438988.1 class I SAM-dependent methyltransferase [Dolichospermum sp. ST_sed3]MDD1445307.1 class I 